VITPLRSSGRALDNLLETLQGQVLLVMGMAGEIDMHAAFAEERALERGSGSLLLRITPVVTTVVDGLMAER
jgi:hypothetical protein